MVSRDGKVRVMDFGLARQTTAADLSTESTESAERAALKLGGDDGVPVPEPDSDAVPHPVASGKVAVKSPPVDLEATRVLRPTGSNLLQSSRPTLERSPISPSALETSLTQTGAMLGTPAYMAPEQFASKVGDARTDQFSFCVALYESLYGQRPFEGKSFMALMTSVARGIVRDAPVGTRVPTWIRRVIVRGLGPSAESRHPSMTVLLDALERDPSIARGRWAIGAASAVLACGVIFGTARSLQARHTPCEGGAAKLAGVWEPGPPASARKLAIHAAFSATGKGYAEQTFETVKRVLDKYTTAWTNTYTDACEATAVRGEQSAEVLDLRMSCLQGRLDSVKALTDLFARADGNTVENAASAVGALGDIGRCSDVPVLRAVVKPPDDPATRSRVNAIAPRLARVKALTDAGHISEALALARPLASEARAIGYLPTTAHALRRLAELATADPAEREALGEQTIWAAQGGGDDELVAEAAIFQAYLSGYRQIDTKRARLWLELTEATLRRLGGHDLLRAWLVNNQGLLAEVEGRYEEAIAAQRRAVELKEKILGPDHPDVATSLGNLANVLAKVNRVSEALELSQRAVRIDEKALGADHPEVARELANRAEQLVLAKRFDEAEQMGRRATQIFEREMGSNNPVVAFGLSVVGRSLIERGRSQDARPLLERAYTIRKLAEKDPEHRGEAAFLLAQVLWHHRADRERALTLAFEAKQSYSGGHDKEALVAVERWLNEHDAL
jgi:tetratricopeptide (TPR) repeat protein